MPKVSTKRMEIRTTTGVWEFYEKLAERNGTTRQWEMNRVLEDYMTKDKNRSKGSKDKNKWQHEFVFLPE